MTVPLPLGPEDCPRNPRLVELPKRPHPVMEFPGPLPKIVMNGRHLREVIDDAWQVLRDAFSGSSLFVRSGRLVRIVDRKSGLSIEELDSDAVFGLLIRAADWVNQQGGPVTPFRVISRDMIATPHPHVAPLDAIVAGPVFTQSGDLIVMSGYHKKAALFLDPEGLQGMDEALQIPTVPTPYDVAAARTLILDELLVDFPFVAAADRAHAVGALLMPSVRRMIRGPTPGNLIEAPTAGSGKGLFADLVSLIVTGETLAGCSLPTDEDERRRTLTAELLNGRPIILIDNLDNTSRSGMLHSATLAAILTAEIWSDRIIRTSLKRDIPNRGLWLFTANNPRLSMELARRCVRIRLDPGVDRPWLRSGFRHPDLRSWVRNNRPELVRALLVLIQNWIAEGRLPCGKTLGSFESWANVIGGVLDAAGIRGFLDNLDALYEAADAEQQMWLEFVEAWWADCKNQPKRPSELNSLCNRHEMMLLVRSSGNRISQETRLGVALDRARDRTFGRHRICLVSDKGPKKGRRYALEHLAGFARTGEAEGGLDSERPPAKTTDTSEGCSSGDASPVKGPPEVPASKTDDLSDVYESEGDVGGPL